MQSCMRKLVDVVPSRAPSDLGERIRWVAMAYNEIADVLWHSDPKNVDTLV